MIEKPHWLFKGAMVYACGKKGVVTECPTNELQGKTWVYNCRVRLEGQKGAATYHPGDLSEIPALVEK